MQRIGAIAILTWKAAFRFRLFWVLAGLLLAAVGLLPLLLKDDGTARGFVQLVVTYNLSILIVLLGVSTLWLACGTLARDIEECQMQVVAVKPIARWQIWLGKWLGLVLLDAALLALAGGCVYGLLQWRAAQLSPDQQTILRHEVFIARGSLRPPLPDIDALVEARFRERLQEVDVPASDHGLLRRQLREQIKSAQGLVPPGGMRTWFVESGVRRNLGRDETLRVRVKFHPAVTSLTGTYRGIWQFGGSSDTSVRRRSVSMAADAFHEFPVPPGLFDDHGRLAISFVNLDTTALLFPIEDGFEVLYRDGGFGWNYVRGLLVILCWMALLAALGLASASLLSFPVAAFLSVSLLLVSLSSGTMASVVAEGTVTGVDHETGMAPGSWVDLVLIPFFQGLLRVIQLVQAFSPVDALSTGRSIPWSSVGLAGVQIVLLLGGVCAAAGIGLFTRRELAAVEGTA
ncbi:MAG: hypothetical protein JXQ71_03045 [Verrucomicrobia bacterium]|nr:hypothetical protein [Verrucomicrobiota bacterium]